MQPTGRFALDALQINQMGANAVAGMPFHEKVAPIEITMIHSRLMKSPRGLRQRLK